MKELRMVREHRSSCAATHHDTSWAYRRYGCRCRLAVCERSNSVSASASGRRPVIRSAVSDHAAVSRVLNDHDGKVAISVGDITVMTEILTRRGWSARKIAERLHVCSRTITRHRSAIRERAVA